MSTFKIVSFNVRGAFGVDGENEFSLRKEALSEYVRHLNPDAIGFQEISEKMRLELISLLPEYAFLGGGREKNRLGESSAIAYRQTRLMPERVFSEILSPTPHLCGTTWGIDQSVCPRIFTSCDFMPFDSETPIRVMNIHTDHAGKTARIIEVSQLLTSYNEQQALRPMPTFILGDFNAEPDSPEIKMLSESEIFTDATESLSGTFHYFGKMDTDTKIDYIFTSGEIKILSCKAHRRAKDGRFLSDHDLIEVTVEI